MATYTHAAPDAGALREVTARTRAIKFGDGYEQRTPDGLNNVVEKWSLSWTVRTKATIDAIDDFLASQAGSLWFYWTTPRGQTKKFKCPTWTPVYNNDSDCSMTAVFEQVFEP